MYIKDNIIDFQKYAHPKVGHLYEYEEDVFVLVLSKDDNNDSCHVRVVTGDSIFGMYSNSQITVHNSRFSSSNYIGDYEDLIG